VREYLLTLVVVMAVTYVLTPLARRLSMLIGAFTAVRDRDVHTIPTPRLGGLAMYGGVAAGLLVASRLPTLQQIFQTSDARGVLLGGAVLCLLGAIDDKWGLDALTKLAGQILAAGVMVLQGLQLLFLPIPRFGTLVLSPDIGVPATVLLVVLTVNAVNFIDGLDGLAAGVVAIAALAFFAYSYQLSVIHGFAVATPPTLITAILAGVCLGFLPHNFHPARVFMGDSGAMLLGLMLAAATISLTGQLDPNAIRDANLFPTLLPLLLPLAVLAVPLVDLLFAVVRRAWGGRSPMSPDKAHLHHRLLQLGHSHTRAVLIMYLWAALLAGSAVSLSVGHAPHYLIAVLLAAGVVALAASIGPHWWARTRAGTGDTGPAGG
jgi:UDP-GlcNAc:undecaprenyl-phosphate GlcNAc-1-phosphate transferase